ncbi:SLBB domain-containing protein [Hydrocarboniphaga daqingensis]|nr:SLBB domain-containing protein [Hydrocarboniphaga daqingensis]
MRVVVRLLLWSLITMIGYGSPVLAQSSLIDPSVLSQLSDEEKARLLGGLGNGDAGSIDQDRELQNPQVVRPRSPSGSGSPVSNDDLDYDDVLVDRESTTGYATGVDGAEFDRGSVSASGRDTRTESDAANADLDTQSNRIRTQDRDRPALTRSGANQRRRDSTVSAYANDGSRVRKPSLKMEGRLKPRPFGYELFAGVPSTFAPATDIPVPGDYVIGPGDNVRVQLFGNQNQTFTLLVSRDGTVNFPKLGPISTNGMRFDELQALLENRVSKEMIGTTASVTLGRLRSMRVFVLGDVTRPGSYTVSSLSTMTHALFVSGGVTAVGSLRRVQLKRSGELIQTLDLYKFLLGGDSSDDVRLQPGDVIFVPPVAARVTVEGEVKRPAIYEIGGERTLSDLIALAGGRLASSDQTYIEVERVTRDAQRRVLNFDMSKAADLSSPIQDGDVVRVRRIAQQIANEIRVIGHVKYPGSYPWADGRDLRTVLDQAGVRSSDIETEVYLPLGIIERSSELTGIRQFVAFNVAEALSGASSPLALQPNDVVVVFSRDDVDYLNSYEVEAVLGGKPIAAGNRCEALSELDEMVNSQRAVRFLRALSSENHRLEKTSRRRMSCPEIFETVPRALPFLLDKSVAVYGEVVRPGIYPVADQTELELLLRAAAGVTGESDSRNVEYLSYADSVRDGKSSYRTLDLTIDTTRKQAVAAGDVFNFRPVYLDQEIGSVRLIGEVRFPGTYGLIRGETLSQMIARAGGLTTSAFPYGAVFTRDSARAAETASYKRAADELQEAVVTIMTNGSLTGDVSSVAAFLDGVVKRLQNAKATGRVVVQADPALLRLRPEQDVILESGDALLIPKRPTSVSIAGQVLNPGSQLFVSGDTADDYLRRAGGVGEAADKDRAFIIYPNGEARPLKLGAWQFQKPDVPPGSLIIVPRDATPLNKLVLSERLLSIFSNLAISAAALVTIGNN